MLTACSDSGAPGSDPATRLASQGLLDLRDAGIVDARSRPTRSLDGEWELIRGRHLSPTARSDANESPTAYETVPGEWPAPVDDFATYRLRVIVPESLVGETLALRLPIFSTAYSLYINGVLLAKVGEAGTNRTESTPVYRKLVKSFRADQSTLGILIHVSNFHHRKGGFIESARISPEEKIQSEREIALFMDFFLFGALLIMALYHFGLVLNRRDDIPSLVFVRCASRSPCEFCSRANILLP